MKKILTVFFCSLFIDHAFSMEEIYEKLATKYQDQQNIVLSLKEYNDLAEKREKNLSVLLNDREKLERDSEKEQQLLDYIIDIERRIKESRQKIVSIVDMEIREASRAPVSHEIDASFSLIRLYSSYGISIDEVRFIDARTLIDGIILPNEKKEYFKTFLNPDVNLQPLINKLANEASFVGPYIKQRVLQTMADGINESRIYRDSIVAFIARLESSVSACVLVGALTDGVDFFPEPVIFQTGEISSSYYDAIYMNYDENILYDSLFLKSPWAIKACMSKKSVLFHECGHSTSGHFVSAALECDMDKTMRLASKFTVAEANKLCFETAVELLSACDDIHNKHIIESIKLSGRVHSDNEIIETMTTSRLEEFIAEIVLSNSTEVFQMFGLMLLECNNKNTLYINLLSDFALFTELGLPIRCYHCSNEGAYQYEQALELCPNNIYGALFNIYGNSIEQYVLKLMFPNGLTSALKEEYSLWKTCEDVQYSTDG